MQKYVLKNFLEFLNLTFAELTDYKKELKKMENVTNVNAAIARIDWILDCILELQLQIPVKFFSDEFMLNTMQNYNAETLSLKNYIRNLKESYGEYKTL